MAAVISGNGLGLFNSSLNQLGFGLGGNARLGQGGNQYINIASGNLVLQSQDEQLLFRGMSIGQLRTYNSQGTTGQMGSDGWLTGFERKVELLSGTLNTAGSVMRLHTGDGSFQDFTYSSANTYVSSTGDGAHDTLTWASGPKTWTYVEGSTRRQELYADHANAVLKGRITRISDLKSDGTTPVGWDVLYDSNGRISQIRSRDTAAGGNPDGLVFGYDASGRLSTLSTRENGIVRGQVAYEYDAAGRLAAVLVDLTPLDAAGDRETWDGSTAANNDGYLFRTTYTYTDASSLQIASVRHSDGTLASYTYDPSGRIATITQGDTNTNDADGVGNTITFTYDTVNRTTNVADAAGRAWSYRYDASGQLVEVQAPAIDGLRDSSSYSYDSAGNLTQVRTTHGAQVLAQTDYSYDASGNLLWEWRTIDPNAGGAATAISRTYTSNNQLASETVYTGVDPDGANAAQAPTGGLTSNYIYDAQNRIRFAINAAGEVSEIEYATSGNAIGQAVRSRQYLGEAYASGTYTLSALTAWATTARKADSALVESSYDLKGRLSQTKGYASVDSAGAGVEDDVAEISNYVYDAQGLLRQKITMRSSTETANDGRDTQQAATYAYDGMGRLLSEVVTERVGAGAIATLRTTTWSYRDSGSALRTIIEGGKANDGITANDLLRTEVRNAAGQIVAVTESALSGGASHVTQHYYDESGLLRASEDAGGARTYFFYDNAGRLVGMVDEIGAMTVYGRDAMGRVTNTLTYATRVDTSSWLVGGAVVPEDITTIAPIASADDRSLVTAYDGLGRVTTQTDAEGGITRYVYDGAGRLLQTTSTDALGTTATARISRLFYDTAGRQIASLDAEGYLIECQYDRAGRKIREVAYAAATPQAQRASGTLTDLRPQTNAQDQVSRYFYDGHGNLIGSLDAEGYLTEFVYDQARNERAVRAYATQLTGLTGAESLSDLLELTESEPKRETRRSFNALGQVTNEVNREGTATRYTYDAQGRLLRTESAYNRDEWEIRENNRRYDVFGNLIGELGGTASAYLPGLTEAEIDEVYATQGIRHSYDSLNRRIESIDAEGNKTWYFYDGAGQQTYVVRGVADSQGVRNALGEVVETRYTAFGQVRDTTAFTGRIALAVPGSRASASAAIEVLSYVGQTDSRAQFSYDRRGLVTQRIDAEGAVVSITYDAFGGALQVLQQIDENRTTKTVNTYDRRGLQTSQTADADALARATNWTYDAFGRAISVIDGSGHETTFGFDRLGRQVTQSTTVTGRVEQSSISYDAYGRVLTQTDAAGKSTTYAYDDENLKFTVTTPEGVTMTTTRNFFGEKVEVVDALGNSWPYDYDLDGRLVQEGDPESSSYYTYDARGLLIASQDGSGREVSYTYDAAGRILTRTQDPDGLLLTTHYAYDGQGRQISVTDPAGGRTTMLYDREGRLAETVRDPDGLALRTTYEWDARGLRLSVTEGAGTTDAQTVAYAYDGLGRRTSETTAPLTLNLTTTYAYDASDNLVSRTDADNRVTRYSYDEAGRQIFAVDGAGGVTESTYDVAGRLVASRTYAQAIDTAGLSTYASSAAIRARVTANDVRDVQQFRVYDDDGRLRFSIDGAGAVESRKYDAAGRMIESVRYATAVALDAGLRSQLTAGTALDSVQVTEDIARDLVNWFVYDDAGRLSYTVDGQGAVTSTEYDGADRITSTATHTGFEDLNAQYYVWDPETEQGVFKTARDILSNGLSAYDFLGESYYSIDWSNIRAEGYAYDGAGRLEYTITTTTIRSDEYGYGAYPDYARGAVHAYKYDAAGRVVAEIDYGNAIDLYQSSEGFASTMSLEQWSSSWIEEELIDTLGEGGGDIEDIPQRVTRYAYDTAGRQRFAIDAAGAVTEQRFNAVGEVLESRSYGTLMPSAPADEAALVTLLQNSTDYRSTLYSYDDAGRLRVKTDALGKSETYVYDGAGLLLSYTNRDNHQWTYEYDAAGRRTAETSPPVAVATADATGNVSVTTRSVVSRISYDGQGNVLSRTEDADTGNARTTHYAYDNRGHQIRITFPDAGQLDANGALVASGVTPTIEVTYNTLGQAVVQKDVRGNYSYKAYDTSGLLAYEIDETGYVTRYQHNGHGDQALLMRYATPIQVTAGQAISTQQIAGMIVVDSAKDRVIQTIYDTSGRKEQVNQGAWIDWGGGTGQVGTGGVTKFAYNAYGELVRESTLLEVDYYSQAYGEMGYGRWASTFHYYDDLGRKTYTLAPEGFVTGWTYTAQGEVSEQIEYARAINKDHYSILDSLPEIPPPGSASTGYDRVTRWQYDALGRKVAETAVRHYQDSDGNGGTRDVVTAIGYDNEGHALTVSVDGQTTTTTYDALGRSIAVKESERSVLRGDAASLLAASASLSLSDAGLYAQTSPYSTMAYDAFGNVVQLQRFANGLRAGETAPVASAGDSIHVTRYDWQGRNVWEKDAAGTVFRKTYDAADNVLEVSYRLDGNDGRWAQVRSVNTYDASGRQITRAVIRDQYVGASQTGSQTDTSERVIYNGFGEIVAKDSRLDPQLTASQLDAQFVYDQAGHLIRSNAQGGVWRNYGYDLAGNQIVEWHQTRVETSPGVSQLITVETHNETDLYGRVVKQIMPTNSDDQQAHPTIEQKYDRWGNVIEATDARNARTNYEYNEQNQVVREIRPEVKVVAADGSETNTRPVSRWFYDALGRQVGSQDANGNIRRNVYDAAGRLISNRDATNALTRVAYDSFGQQLLTQDALGYVSYRDFDNAGRIVAQGDYLTNDAGTLRERKVREQYTLNQNGDRLVVLDALLQSAKYDYDSRGKVIRSRTAGGIVMSFGYDANGNKIRETNALSDPSLIGGSGGRTTLHDQEDNEDVYLHEQTWNYDYFNRIVDHNDLSGTDYDYQYDSVTGQAIGQSNDWTAQGRVVDTPWQPGGGHTLPGGYEPPDELPEDPDLPTPYGSTGNRQMAYYANGLLKEIRETTTAGTNWTRYAYDASGNRTLEESFSYDATGRAQHLRTSITYDSHNRVMKVVQDDVAQGRQLLEIYYNYDAVGNRTQVISRSIASDLPTNPDFEDGDAGWELGTGFVVEGGGGAQSGSYKAVHHGTGTSRIINKNKVLVEPGQSLEVRCYYHQGSADAGDNKGAVLIVWYDENGNEIGSQQGNIVRSSDGGFQPSGTTGVAPPGARYAAIGGISYKTRGNAVRFDNFSWNYAPIIGGGSSSGGSSAVELPNPGFELDLQDWVADPVSEDSWEVADGTSADPNDTDPSEGTHYVRFLPGTTQQNSGSLSGTLFAVTAGETITARVNISPIDTVGGTFSGRIEIQWLDASGTVIHTTLGNDVSGINEGWQQSFASDVPPAGAVNARIVLRAETAPTTGWHGQVSFDEVSVIRTGGQSSGDTPYNAPEEYKTYWYSYDAENRVSVVNGNLVDGQIVLGNADVSYALSYDAAGNATHRRFLKDGNVMQEMSQYDQRGQRETVFEAQVLGSSDPLQLSESFDYDDLGRQTKHRTYDSAGLKHLDRLVFDADGRVLLQTSFGQTENNDGEGEWPDGEGLALLSQVDYSAGNGYGYDQVGRSRGYSFYAARHEVGSGASGSTPIGYAHFYAYQYEAREGYLEKQIYGHSTNSNFKASTSYSSYDAWGRRTAVREQTPGQSSVNDQLRYFSYDMEGNILRRREGTLVGGNFNQTMTEAGRDQAYAYVTGQQVGSVRRNGEVDVIGRLTAYDSSEIGSVRITVQAGDTLRSIAQRVYGNGNLWYVLAEANAITDEGLSAGATLNVPEVKVSSNDSGTFKPFNPSEAIGDTAPSLPYITPPPKRHCQALSQLISVVVTIVVTFYAGPAAGAAAGNLAGQYSSMMLNGEYDWSRAAKFALNPFSGSASDFARQIYDPAANGAPGKADYRSVAISAAAGYAGSFAGQFAGTLTGSAALGAAAGAAAGYVTSYGLSRAAGYDADFSLRGLGASAASAYAGSMISTGLGVSSQRVEGSSAVLRNNAFSWSAVSRAALADVFSSAVGYGVNKAFRVEAHWNWDQVAADVFGNALGNAAVGGIQRWQESRRIGPVEPQLIAIPDAELIVGDIAPEIIKPSLNLNIDQAAKRTTASVASHSRGVSSSATADFSDVVASSSSTETSNITTLETVTVVGTRPRDLTMNDLSYVWRQIASGPRQSIAEGVRLFDRDALDYARGSFGGRVRSGAEFDVREALREQLQQADANSGGKAQLVMLAPDGMSPYEMLVNSLRTGGGYISEEVGQNLLDQINSGASAIDLTYVRAQSEGVLNALQKGPDFLSLSDALSYNTSDTVGLGIESHNSRKLAEYRANDPLLPANLTISEPGVQREVNRAFALASTLGGIPDLIMLPLALARGSISRAPTYGALSDSVFAQVPSKSTKPFSVKGTEIYTGVVGRPIKTVGDLTDALKQGAVKPSQLPIDYVVIDGHKVIANTRSSTALINAGIPKSQWYGVNRTGLIAYDSITFDDLVRNQLINNYGGSVLKARR